jgi:hypothetical protein
MDRVPEPRSSPHAFRWWLNLQIALGLAGGLIWFAGASWSQEFLSGVGCGLIAAALVLRVGRRAAED